MAESVMVSVNENGSGGRRSCVRRKSACRIEDLW